MLPKLSELSQLDVLTILMGHPLVIDLISSYVIQLCSEQESGLTDLAELSELDLAGAVLVDLLQDLLKLLFRGPANREWMNCQYMDSN